MGTEIWAWETMMRTPWHSAHHLDLSQPLLDHGPWADAKEPSNVVAHGQSIPAWARKALPLSASTWEMHGLGLWETTS